MSQFTSHPRQPLSKALVTAIDRQYMSSIESRNPKFHMIDIEERAIILYALYRCGGTGRKGRIIHYIVENDLLKPREGDGELRQTNETKLENDLAWARADLKNKNLLSMPEHGFWQITELGQERLFDVAKKVFAAKPDPTSFERCSTKFINELFELGRKLSSIAEGDTKSPSQ
jgi:hypothetical protein